MDKSGAPPKKKNLFGFGLVAISIITWGVVAYANFPNYWPYIQKLTGSDQLEIVANKTFTDDRIVLDGHAYTHCVFNNVTFEYNGARFEFTYNEVRGARFESKNDDIQKAFLFMSKLGILKLPVLGPDQKPIQPGATWH